MWSEISAYFQLMRRLHIDKLGQLNKSLWSSFLKSQNIEVDFLPCFRFHRRGQYKFNVESVAKQPTIQRGATSRYRKIDNLFVAEKKENSLHWWAMLLIDFQPFTKVT